MVDGLNLYVYVGNNPLKYMDPTGHVKVYSVDMEGYSSRHLPHNLVRALCVVFATFAQDMGADVQGDGLLFCFVG
jgi:hypothetical protein